MVIILSIAKAQERSIRRHLEDLEARREYAASRGDFGTVEYAKIEIEHMVDIHEKSPLLGN